MPVSALKSAVLKIVNANRGASERLVDNMILQLPSKQQKHRQSLVSRLWQSRRTRTLDVEALAKLYPPRPQFYPLSKSPHVELRNMAANVVQHSSCPQCVKYEDFMASEQWDDPRLIPGGTNYAEPAPKTIQRPSFECPDCGWPTHCSEEHWLSDLEEHKKVCGQLRQWTMDEHDAKSGRKFWEMTFPGRQQSDAVLNFSGWPYLLTTRKFPRALLASAVAQRHISRFLTYPYTIASLLHKPWIYYNENDRVGETDKVNVDGSIVNDENAADEEQQDNAPAVQKSAPTTAKQIVTDVGWHLFSSLSHAVDVATKMAALEFSRIKSKSRKIAFSEEPTAPTMNNDPFRIFVVGARTEARLPAFVWEQLSLTFPGVPFRVYFIGPEVQPTHLPVTSNAEPLQHHRQIFNTSSVVHQRTIPLSPKLDEDEQMGEDEQSKQEQEQQPQTVQSLVTPVSVNLRLEYITAPYEQVHESFGPFQRRRDIFLLFNSGIGHPSTRSQWTPALKKILKTRCLAVFTSMNEQDQERDVRAIQEDHAGEYVVAMRPCGNKFSSMRPDVTVDCAHDYKQWTYSNWGVFAVHGVGTAVGERLEDVAVEEEPKRGGWFW